MTATRSTANWRSAGACLSADPDLFFPVSPAGPAHKQIIRAKMICAGCAVRRQCLEFALTHGQTYGIWGGAMGRGVGGGVGRRLAEGSPRQGGLLRTLGFTDE